MIETEVRGLAALQRKKEQVVRDLHGGPLLDAMRDCTLWVANDAKRLAPVDVGRLRASLTPEVRPHGNDVWGIVGSNVTYAPYVETGTRPHWPPLSAVETWARRHGLTAFVVARAIARRGTKAVHYLERAFRQNEGRIVDRIGKAVKEILDK